ncbi:hypothetical protein [Streptomyces fuscichromogenes]|uniref:Membrane transport protein MMPL domain-containing protein n=1 Tax=Streptomyces fuscichromogenes TaxID=1324013 RepID=A0A918CS04_9ACTN|nr:hypothetical protein [Streptomyces fuscichromogenes]GGN10403.1 hypothetical protein GCM10011578_036140 [Streptomyces fuscichromogenes]
MPALMPGLAVGIDYALFIVNRERRLIGIARPGRRGRGIRVRDSRSSAVCVKSR